MTTNRHWKIRDQVGVRNGNVVWGAEREVTLEQYRAEVEVAKAKATAIFKTNAAKVKSDGSKA